MGGELPLVGRASELAVLEALLEHGDARAPTLAEVVGEPGIGKTRLLAELATCAEERGYLVLTSRAAEILQAMPFGVFAAALDDYLTALGVAELTELEPSLYPELATAFSAFVPLAKGAAPALHAERFKTYRAVRTLLEAVGTARPLLLVLDDVHWADPASVELIIHLLARPVVAAPVRVALGYRPAQVPPRLLAALAQGVREGDAASVELFPLSRDEVRAFVGREASHPDLGELYRDSGGNPFYLEQLLRGAGLKPAGQPLGLPEGSVPPPVAAALAAELASLPPTTRTLLEGAAVVGDPFDDELSAVAAELDERTTLTCLDELSALDLIRPTLAPRRFRFRHPIVRRAVYESSKSGWRLYAHARVAAALAHQGAAATALAPHVERSAGRGDHAAIEVLLQAAASAELRAPATAAGWYDAALRLLPAGPDLLPRRVQILAQMAIARGVAGQFQESHAALCQVLELLPERADGRAGLVAFCAAVERLMGRVDDARGRLMRALAEVEGEASPDVVAFKFELAIDAFLSCDYPAMGAWASEAIALSLTLGEPLLEAAALGALVLADHNLALQPGPHLERAKALVDGLPDDVLAQRLDAATWLAFAEMTADDFASAVQHASRVVRIARSTGRGQYIGMTIIGQLYALMFSGRLAEAEDLAESAVDSFRPAAEPALAEALCCRGFVRAARGDLDGAVRDAEEALELHKTRGRAPLLATATAIFLGSFLVDAGAPERARAVVLASAGGPALAFAERRGRAVALEVLTMAELDLGNLAAAEVWARQAEEAPGFGDLPVESAPARRAVAAVRLARGDALAAAQLALVAADEAGAAGSPLESGRSRILAGRALAQAGERERARRELEQAEADLSACGAWALQDEAGAHLRRLGMRRGQPRSVASSFDSLTEREQVVAELVRQGRTNREIAAECYLSVKTVERHVTHLFQKLGVTSRAGVAGIVAGHRPVGSVKKASH